LEVPVLAPKAQQAISDLANACNCQPELVEHWLRPLLTGLTLDDVAFMAAVNTSFQGKVSITLNGVGHIEHFGTTIDGPRVLALMGWQDCVPQSTGEKARCIRLVGKRAQLL